MYRAATLLTNIYIIRGNIMDKKSIEQISNPAEMKEAILDIVEQIADLEAKKSTAPKAKAAPQKGLSKSDRKNLKRFMLDGAQGASLKSMSVIGGTADATIQSRISTELLELAIANSIILQKVGQASVPNGAQYTIPKLASRPTVATGAENHNDPTTDPEATAEQSRATRTFQRCIASITS